jgi:single-strand DNA-binding protein
MSPSKSTPARQTVNAGPGNLAVVVGTLSHDVRSKHLPSGTVVASLDLTTDTAPRDTVPITMVDPPRAVTRLVSGDHVVVVGRVRRRFFRAGGTTQSRTELVAERIARTRVGRSREAALRWAAQRLAALCGTVDPADEHHYLPSQIANSTRADAP